MEGGWEPGPTIRPQQRPVVRTRNVIYREERTFLLGLFRENDEENKKKYVACLLLCTGIVSVMLNLFTILLSRNPVAVESINEGAHHVSRSMGHQTFIQHFLDNHK